MIITIAIVVSIVAVLIAFMIGIVIVGTRQEPTYSELSRQAPTRLASVSRSVLGVYIAKPDEVEEAPTPTTTEGR